MKIVLSKRLYNGDYGLGSVFVDKLEFNIDDSLKTVFKYNLEICIYEGLKNKEDIPTKNANLEISIPFNFSKNTLDSLKDIFTQIQNGEDYSWNSNHYSKDSFDFKEFSYSDVVIDDKEYELLKNDPLLNKLFEIVHFNKSSIGQIDRVKGVVNVAIVGWGFNL